MINKHGIFQPCEHESDNENNVQMNDVMRYITQCNADHLENYVDEHKTTCNIMMLVFHSLSICIVLVC